MNVLFVTHYPGFGGANQSCLHLMLHLRKKHGVSPIVLTPFKGPWIDKCAEQCIPCHTLRYASWRNPRSGFVGFLYGIVMVLVNVAAIIPGVLFVRRNKIDLIHANSSLAFFGWLLAKASGVPIVWHLREYGYDGNPMPFYLGDKISGRIMRTSDAVIAISRDNYEYYSRLMGCKGRIHLVYNGIDDDDRAQKAVLPTVQAFSPTGFKLCTIGDISENKNQVIVVRALGVLKRQNLLKDIHYYVVGGKTFDDVVAEEGLQDRIHVLGNQDNIWPYVSKTDVGIIPSLHEAFGRVAVECMLCGLPVIASRTGGLAEIVEDGVSGFLFDSTNAEELAEKIQFFYNHRDKVREMGEQARKRALTHFSAETNADNVYKIYESCLCRQK